TEINVFTGSRRSLGSVPRADHYVFTRDGSGVLLFDDVPSSSLLALSPQPLLATGNLIAAARFQGQPETPVWRRYRVCSLPDLREIGMGELPPMRPPSGGASDFIVP